MTIASLKGKAIWRKTKSLLGRGYNWLTAQELKIARYFQHKIPAGFEITRIVFLLIKIALGLFILFTALWLLVGIFLIMAFIISSNDPKTSQEILEETPGSSEHKNKYPWEYDEWGGHRG